MRLIKPLVLYTLLLCGFNLYAQQKGTTVDLFYEKAYLHTDRDMYTQGDTLWFKAYLLNAQNNKPIGYSNNLYVELIGPGLQIITSETIRLDGGLGNGDIKLADTLKAGTYRIRAYTNWMRNFGDKFIYEKSITVVNTSGAKPGTPLVIKPVKRVKQKAGLAGIKDTLPIGPMVSFFPEGGHWVNDVKCTVAFKAEDERGRGIAVNGNLLASSGRVVAKFSCDSTGMGSFELRPDDSQKYHAELMISGKPYSFKMAAPLHKGFVLSVNTVPGTIVAEIDINGFTLSELGGTSLVIVAKHGGKICYKHQVTISSKSSMVQIPDANFPEGIACITLFDEYGRPVSERLVYVHHDNAPRLLLTTDKQSYGPKEKVTVKIKLTDTTKTHLSLSAVDAGMVPVKPGDMAYYLNLRSEVKGSIEHPERYFDTTNLNRFKQLDMLLLTQGWRSYLWQRIADTIPSIKYDVEQGISITGKVRRLFRKSGLNGMSITMFAPKAEGKKLFATTTDADGRFVIDGAVIYGYQFLNFTSRRADKINDEGEAKGRSGGWIQVDSLNEDQLVIHPAIAEADTVAPKSDSLLARAEKQKKFTFTGNNQLKTVQVKAYTNMLEPIVQSVGKTEHKEYDNLMQYLLYVIPDSRSGTGGCRLDTAPHAILQTGHKPVMHVGIRGTYADNSQIDYAKVCDEDYLFQPMTNIYKITINRRQTVYGIVYSVAVVLKPHSLDLLGIFDNTVADVTGYYKARQFYTPRYDASSDKPDYRTTIHWEPNITTDANGEATISFYNADPKSKIRLIVQGVTDKGVVLTGGVGYEVK